jgi:hypothetical protein
LASSDPYADGKTQHIPASDADGALLIFTINAVSTYNAGTDETTVSINNADTFDITFGYAASAYPDNLRVIPFNYSFQVNSAHLNPSGGQYETMDILGAYGLDVVTIQGEQFLSQITDVSIDGRILKFDVEVSENKQYKTNLELKSIDFLDKLVQTLQFI